MKPIKTICIHGLLILLAGCSANGTLQPSQLTKAAQLNETHCYSIALETVEKRIGQYLEKCFISGGFNSNFIKTDNIGNGRRVSLSDGSTYQYAVELRQSTNECQTQAKMYGIDKSWKKVLSESNLAVFEKTYSCP